MNCRVSWKKYGLGTMLTKVRIFPIKQGGEIYD